METARTQVERITLRARGLATGILIRRPETLEVRRMAFQSIDCGFLSSMSAPSSVDIFVLAIDSFVLIL